MVSIDKRSTPKGEARWLVRWRDDAGKSKARTFKTKREAGEFRATLALQLVNGTAPDEARRRATVKDAYQAWLLAHPNWARTTRSRYESIWSKHVEPNCGDVQLRKVRRADIQSWVVAISVKRATQKKILVVLSGALGQALADRWISSNVALDVRLPAEEVTERRAFLTRQQVADLATAADEIANAGWHAGIIVNVLGHAGLRFGELAGLQMRDVNVHEGWLDVRRSLTEENGRLIEGPPKGGKARRVYVPAWLMEDISPLVQTDQPEERLFKSPRGAPLRLRGVRRSWWDKALLRSWAIARHRELEDAEYARRKEEDVGIEVPEPVVDVKDDAARDAWASRITPHALRHTAASLAISQGLTVMQVQRMLGHARPSITLDIYADLFDADAVGGAMKLNAAHQAWVESARSHAEEREAFEREAASARAYARDHEDPSF